MEIFIKPETEHKMKKLLSIVGGSIILEEHHKDYIHMIVRKEQPPYSGQLKNNPAQRSEVGGKIVTP